MVPPEKLKCKLLTQDVDRDAGRLDRGNTILPFHSLQMVVGRGGGGA